MIVSCGILQHLCHLCHTQKHTPVMYFMNSATIVLTGDGMNEMYFPVRQCSMQLHSTLLRPLPLCKELLQDWQSAVCSI